jgi:hypothetical protein
MSGHDFYGPCHLCGVETPERHGRILIGCCQTEGSTTITVEICIPCREELRRGQELPCPLDTGRSEGRDWYHPRCI